MVFCVFWDFFLANRKCFVHILPLFRCIRKGKNATVTPGLNINVGPSKYYQDDLVTKLPSHLNEPR